MAVIDFKTSDYPPMTECKSTPAYSDFPEQKFADELERFRLVVDGAIQTGEIVRVNHRDNPGKKSGWYLYFGQDPVSGIAGGVYGDWRYSDERQHWSNRTEQDVTPQQWAHYQQRVAEAKAKADAEKKERQDATAMTCQDVIANRPLIDSHPYLNTKRVKAHGLHLGDDGALIIPMRNSLGENRNIQRIYPDGKKFFAEGGQVLGCYHLIGDQLTSPTYVTEGYATGATVHEATRCAVIVAFNTGNLKPAAEAIRKHSPDISLVFCADNDRFTDSNPGITYAKKAAETVGNSVVKVPEFKSPTGTDFNDLMMVAGIDTVKTQLHHTGFNDGIVSAGKLNLDTIEAREWVYDRLLLSGYITACIAPGGTGKSVLSMTIAVSVALGIPLLGDGHTVPEVRNVLILNNEDDLSEITRRLAAITTQYGIDHTALDNKLFIRSGYNMPAMLASTDINNKVQPTSHTSQLIDFVNQYNIGLIIADPLISLHDIPENDNTQIDHVVKILRRICGDTGAALMVLTHTKKTGGDSELHAGDAELMRGASAVKDAARIAFTLVRMGKKGAEQLGIDWEIASRFIRLDDAKKNFSAQDTSAEWYAMESVRISNGDFVGVPVPVDIEDYATMPEDSKPEKMTGTRFAELIELHGGSDVISATSFLFKDIKPRLKEATNYSNATIAEWPALLSHNQQKPTRIKVNNMLIDYTVRKDGSGSRAPWRIYRQELN